jgi:hypothetical protein
LLCESRPFLTDPSPFLCAIFFCYLLFTINNKPPTIVEGLLLFVYLNNYAVFNNWLRNVIAVLLFEKFLEILEPFTDALTRYELPSKYTLLDTGT